MVLFHSLKNKIMAACLLCTLLLGTTVSISSIVTIRQLVYQQEVETLSSAAYECRWELYNDISDDMSDHDKVAGILQGVRVYDSGFAYIVSADGSSCYTADHVGMPMQALQRKEVEQRQMVEGNHEITVYRFRQEKVSYDEIAVPLSDGSTLRVAVPVKEVKARMYRTIGEIMVAVLLALFASLSLTAFLLRNIGRRLDELASVARQVADGKLDVHLDVVGHEDDEITNLTRAFDYTIEALKSERKLTERLTYHDALTGLLNRHGIDRELSRLDWNEPGRRVALLSIDLDNFKFINDLYGHLIGDKALSFLAQILRQIFGDKAILGRNGGDEFIVILLNLSFVEIVPLLDDLIMTSKIFQYDSTTYQFTVSAGLSIFPDLAPDVVQLFQQADAALYATKIRGKNSWCIFKPHYWHLHRGQLGFNLQDITMHLPEPIFIIKAEGHSILYADNAAIRFCGCRSAEELLEFTDNDWVQIFTLEDRLHLVQIVHHMVQTEHLGSRKSCTGHIQTKDGAERGVNILLQVEQNIHHGKILYIVLEPKDKKDQIKEEGEVVLS